jgi:hypothetical protein
MKLLKYFSITGLSIMLLNFQFLKITLTNLFFFILGFLFAIVIISMLKSSTDYFERLLIVREAFYNFLNNKIDIVELKGVIDASIE